MRARQSSQKAWPHVTSKRGRTPSLRHASQTARSWDDRAVRKQVPSVLLLPMTPGWFKLERRSGAPVGLEADLAAVSLAPRLRRWLGLRGLGLGFGRIVASEIEVPNMLVNLV
jgi:hypothetical protein